MDKIESSTTLSSTLCDLFNTLRGEEKEGITFIRSTDQAEFLSYAKIYDEVVLFLHYLKKETNIQAGNELIIYEEDNKKFLICFWACILGGIIPVPVAIGGKNEHILKFFNIWEELNTPFLYSSEAHFDRLHKFIKENNIDVSYELFRNRLINATTSNLPIIGPDVVSPIIYPKAEDIAFIQFSSGTTSKPKGVILSHQNLIYNIHDVSSRMELKKEECVFSWIPLTHDLGMIAFHLSCMLKQSSQIIMPTNLFIRRPISWMDIASRLKPSILFSPNFGFQYFLQALERKKEMPDWDLSSIRSIINGAEPINANLCREFEDTLSIYGLPKNSTTPCYGLAEATVGVTGRVTNRPLKEYLLERKSLGIGTPAKFLETNNIEEVVSFVDVGKPLNHCKIRITDNEGKVLLQNQVGHIELTGPNITSGYYNNPEATEKVFTKDGWLKTGDLGLILENNSLVITGRHKNMIIFQGQNYYAHDIETILLGTSGITTGKVVACSLAENSNTKEKLLIFIYYKKKLELFPAIVQAVSEKLSKVLGIMPDEVIPVREIPKTTSGKVQHTKLLKYYVEGKFKETQLKISKIMITETTGEWQQLTERDRLYSIKQWLLSKCATVRDIQPNALNVTTPLIDQGFKSIHAIQLSQILNKDLGLNAPTTLLYQYPQISQLAYMINDSLFASTSTSHQDTLENIDELNEEQILQMLNNYSDY